MRIACLQFAPQLGDVDNNLNRADSLLSKANPQDLDLLVLPELAFTGYNFKSLQHISPYLEPTIAGITSLWARTTALKYDCVVTAGYPEKVDISANWPASPEYYSSAITVNADGETIANYRKSFLYHTDQTWALEGNDGFYDGEIPGLGSVAMGICMDLNPYKFEAPWSAWEFAHHILHREANLVILSMAWLTREEARPYSRTPKDPDMDTLSYWLARLEPIIRAENEEEIIVVFANRCGVEDDAVYAGTSAVLGIHHGEVKVYGILGRGEKQVLVVDTSRPPQAKLIAEPRSAATSAANDSALAEPITIPPPPPAPTKSTKSSRSAAALSNIVTSSTPKTAYQSSFTDRPTPDAMEIRMDDLIPPLSPIDARSSGTFFPKAEVQPAESVHVLESLKSSIAEPSIFEIAKPDSPTYVRPPSPKSRNCSRNRKPSYQEPALLSHDLAQELDLGFKSLLPFGVVQPPPYSASVLPDQKGFGPRSLHVPSRPKSMIW